MKQKDNISNMSKFSQEHTVQQSKRQRKQECVKSTKSIAKRYSVLEYLMKFQMNNSR